MAYEANTVVELKVGYTVNGQQCYNVFHFKPSGNSTGFAVQDMVTGFVNLQSGVGNGVAVGELKKLLGSNATINRITAQAVYPTRYAQRVLPLNVAGDQANPCEAQNLQASVEKRGELGNRHNVGAVRVGGLPTDAYDNGLITNAYQALLQTFVDDFLLEPASDGISTVEYLPAILNKTKVVVDGKDKYLISGSTLISEAEVMDQVRTQRTRTVGRGI